MIMFMSRVLLGNCALPASVLSSFSKSLVWSLFCFPNLHFPVSPSAVSKVAAQHISAKKCPRSLSCKSSKINSMKMPHVPNRCPIIMSFQQGKPHLHLCDHEVRVQKARRTVSKRQQRDAIESYVCVASGQVG